MHYQVGDKVQIEICGLSYKAQFDQYEKYKKEYFILTEFVDDGIFVILGNIKSILPWPLENLIKIEKIREEIFV